MSTSKLFVIIRSEPGFTFLLSKRKHQTRLSVMVGSAAYSYLAVKDISATHRAFEACT